MHTWFAGQEKWKVPEHKTERSIFVVCPILLLHETGTVEDLILGV